RLFLHVRRVIDQHPGFHLVLRRHARLFAGGGHVIQLDAGINLPVFDKMRRLGLKSHRLHRVYDVAGGLEIVADYLRRDVALQLHLDVVCYEAVNLAPAVFDYGAWLDAGQGERFGFQLETAGLDQLAVEDGVFLQLDDCPVRFDGAPGDVPDRNFGEIGDVDLALRLLAALGEDFDADVVSEVRALIRRGVDVNLPQQRLGVGVFFDHRRLERQVLRVYGLPG